ncbi:MAG: hypothetical protein AB7K36_29575 [Chloroflexota bacterium]
MRFRTIALLSVLMLMLAPTMFPVQPARAQPTADGIYQFLPDGITPLDDDGEGGVLVSGTPVQGTVFPQNDTDEYTVAGQANQWIAIEIMGSNGLRPQVEMLYPNGKLFAESHGELTATRQVQLMTSGVYKVVVKSYPYPSLTTGNYTLKVTIGNSRV